MYHRIVTAVVFAGLLSSCAIADRGSDHAKSIHTIQHIVVIYLENHSFDNLYGLFPGADGIAHAPSNTFQQVDTQGTPYLTLPRVLDTRSYPPIPDERFPAHLPNRPFDIGRYVPIHKPTGDLVHRFYQHQEQINKGQMNQFVSVSNAGGLTMGYYDGQTLPLWDYAQRYTLADRFFQAAFGGSFLNHLWLACACTPQYPNPPIELQVVLNAQGKLLKDGSLTPDGYAVNTMFPAYAPKSVLPKDEKEVLPELTYPTLGDRLSEKGVSWTWYAGGWNAAESGQPDKSFQVHHQPYTYFKNYAHSSPQRKVHLRDEEDFLKDIATGQLPSVSFYKPLGQFNEHPGYTDVRSGDQKAADILSEIEKSSQWDTTVVIVTYDEFGGFWDHVAPPEGDRWGPGSRVPMIIVSPFAKRGHVDHTPYDTTSILRMIEHRFDLTPLGDRDARANDLLDALDF